jgi:hypothetical protein
LDDVDSTHTGLYIELDGLTCDDEEDECEGDEGREWVEDVVELIIKGDTLILPTTSPLLEEGVDGEGLETEEEDTASFGGMAEGRAHEGASVPTFG